MVALRKYRFVLPLALVASAIGLVCWIVFADSDPSRLFEFGIWTGVGTMVPGLLVVTGASDNSFEEGESYDAVRDASQKQERIQGSVPILITTVLAGALIMTVSLAGKYLFLS